MIARIRGEVIGKRQSALLVEVAGLGYLVYTTAETAQAHSVGEETTLMTHHVVREDCQDLYGFRTQEELDVFELLIGVPGIGPRSALSILGLAGLDALHAAVAAEDTSYLTRVSGIG